jgi:ATP-dependent Clp protease ATP-binding subunit ClpB
LAETDDTAEKSLLREEVSEDDIAEVIAKWTGIPVAKLVQSEMEKLLKHKVILTIHFYVLNANQLKNIDNEIN